MSKKLKDSLRIAFYAPVPKRKCEFLLSVNFPKSTRFDFLLAQVRYIRKRVWIGTLLAIVPALIFLFSNITENILGFIWVTSSLLPFIVLMGMTEIARSVSHNMAELEMSCKYSFSDIVLARLAILACNHMVMFAVVIASFRMVSSLEALRFGTYLFVPFLLTCSLSLFALNRLRSNESVYICGGISCFVSILNAVLANRCRIAFSNEHVTLWIIASCLLLAWTVSEITKLIQKTEEHQWNLSLTA